MLSYDNKFDIDLYQRFREPSNPYGNYNNQDRFLNVVYRAWTTGELSKGLTSTYTLGLNSSNELVRTLQQWGVNKLSFNYEKWTNVPSQHFWASTALLGVGYSAARPDLYSSDKDKQVLAQLTLARSVVNSILETSLYVGNAFRWDTQKMSPLLGATSTPILGATPIDASAQAYQDKVKFARSVLGTVGSFAFTANGIVSLVMTSKVLNDAIKTGNPIDISAASLSLLGSTSNITANFLKGMSGVASLTGWSAATGKNLGIAGSAFGLANGLLSIAALAPTLARQDLTPDQRSAIIGEITLQLTGGTLAGVANLALGINIARGATTGFSVVGPLLGVAVAGLLAALSPLEIYGLVKQSEYANKLDELGRTMAPYGYDGDSLLANLYRDKTAAEGGILAATMALSVISTAVTIATAATGVGAPAAAIVGVVLGAVTGILKGISQSIIEEIANDYVNKIKDQGGSFAYFARNLAAQHNYYIQDPTTKEYLDKLQKSYDVDSVIGVMQTKMSQTAKELAAITYNLADLKTAEAYIDRYVNGSVKPSTSTIDIETGLLNLGEGQVGAKQALVFLTPLMVPGKENRVRVEKGKNNYMTSLNNISSKSEWTINDGRSNTVLDLDGIVSRLYDDKGTLVKNISVAVNAGEGDDAILANESQLRIDGGDGNDTVSYAKFGAESSIRVRPTSAGFQITKTLTNVDVYIEKISQESFEYGKRTEASQYRNFEINTKQRVEVVDFAQNVENISGTNGNDDITGDDKANVLIGNGGNDIINGGGGNDKISGGSGADILSGGDGADIFFQDVGVEKDTIDGGSGVDTVDYSAQSNETAAINVNLTTGVVIKTPAKKDKTYANDVISNIENIVGTRFNDTIIGNEAANVLYGGDGNDTINGGGGADILVGGLGNDILMGGAGNDTFVQGMNVGSDNIDGGEGSDTVDYSSDTDANNFKGIVVDLTTQTAKRVISGPGSSNQTVGRSARYIRIYHNNNEFSLALTGLKVYSNGRDIAAGLSSRIGIDGGGLTSAFDNSNTALTDDSLGGKWNGSQGNASNMAFISGFNGYIEIDLGSVQSIDSIKVWGRDDAPNQSNNLKVFFSDQNFGNKKFADLNGNANVAKVNLDNAFSGEAITYDDQIRNIENVVGTVGNDVLIGSNEDNTLAGMAGDDVINGGAGSDNLQGGEGNDQLKGDAGDDILDGGEGNDNLDGGEGDDTLSGGNGADVVLAGSGNDVVYQDTDQFSDVLDGGDGIDELNYSVNSLQGKNVAAINADLSAGTVSKTFSGTSKSVATTARYIRIYHNNNTIALALTGLKVYSNGKDIAAGLSSKIGIDGGSVSSPKNSNTALTDASLGGNWNGSQGNTSNLAYVDGLKGYIEIDLGSAQDIDSISLWGRSDAQNESNDLRIFFSDQAFGAKKYENLTQEAVNYIDVSNVTSSSVNTIVKDTISNFEKLMGTSLNDVLKGDNSANALLGGKGNDTIDGGAGDDSLSGGLGDDIIKGGDGNDTFIQDLESGSDNLDGGDGADLVQYNFKGNAHIEANLAKGFVNKVSNTLENPINKISENKIKISENNSKTRARYIRIYHNNNESVLALTGLRVYSTGMDIAAGLRSSIGIDGRGSASSPYNSNTALTDANIGGKWNAREGGDTSNFAFVDGYKGYIEIDLGSVQDIDSISVWGRDDFPSQSNNLRVFFSEQAFSGVYDNLSNKSLNPSIVTKDIPIVNIGFERRISSSPYTTDRIQNIESLEGTEQSDLIVGDDKVNALKGGGGNDEISGAGGDDTLFGDSGDDTLNGDAGDDLIIGGSGSDTINGGDGDDVILQDQAETEVDTIDGGAGSDTIDYSKILPSYVSNKGISADLVSGTISKYSSGTYKEIGYKARYIRIYHNNQTATDIIALTGLKVYSNGRDIAAGLRSSIGNIGYPSTLNSNFALTDANVGGNWNGRFGDNESNMAYVMGNNGYIEIDLGSVQDIDSISLWGVKNFPDRSNNLRIFFSDQAVGTQSYENLTKTVNYTDVSNVTTSFGETIVNDQVSNIENVIGTSLNDTLTGDSKNNLLSGGAGNDVIRGGAGNDILLGGAGSDNIDGEEGDDIIQQNIEAVSDTINGGAGNDTLDYSAFEKFGGETASIDANLSTGNVAKKFFGTNKVIGNKTRYIRIYHNNNERLLALTDLKIYSNGRDIAAGLTRRLSIDGGGSPYTYSTNNLTLVDGLKSYIEIDLGSVQDIDSISLWGRSDFPNQSNNLRVFFSNQAFGEKKYENLTEAVNYTDVKEVRSSPLETIVNDQVNNVENVIGTSLNDMLTGNSNDNILSGGAGNDVINGGAGNDTLNGGSGDDNLYGGSGDDVLIGGSGADNIEGGDGNDLIYQGLEDVVDTIDGGAGADLLDYRTSSPPVDMLKGISADLVNGTVSKYFSGTNKTVGAKARYIRIYHNNNENTLALTGLKVYSNGRDIAAGLLSSIGIDWGRTSSVFNNNTALTDTAVGGAWNDREGNTSNLAIVGGVKSYIEIDLGSVQDIDSISLWGRSDFPKQSNNLRVFFSDQEFGEKKYENLTPAVNYTDVLEVTSSPVDRIVKDKISNIENVEGTSLNDEITGDSKDNLLSGGAGNDVIKGGAGNDLLLGGAGSDQIEGGEGNDIIQQNMEAVSDSIDGGAGNDTLDYSLFEKFNAEMLGIDANLSTGTVAKKFSGTNKTVGVKARYIRIYHNNNESILALTGLKVYSNDRDIAAGLLSSIGIDEGTASSGFNSNTALTDASLGGNWNGSWGNASNQAIVSGTNSYIEIDLGSVQVIDSISLWGKSEQSSQSNNLRVFFSDQAFGAKRYANLTQAVNYIDVSNVAPSPYNANTTVNDKVSNIENVVGTSFSDTLTGDSKDNILSGGGGNDIINGGAGNDTLNGGAGNDAMYGNEGDDIFKQGVLNENDTMNGGDGIDTVDYSSPLLLTGAGIIANLSTNTIIKEVSGTSRAVTTKARYIRIYHNNSENTLALTGLKVYSNGRDIAAGLPSGIGSNGGSASNLYNSPTALTDANLGNTWNNLQGNASNIAYVTGEKSYIEIDLGSVQDIDSISLWGRGNSPNESNNLRMFFSDQAFGTTTYDAINSNVNVNRMDFDEVRSSLSTPISTTDLVYNIENVIGSSLNDAITGDEKNNRLEGGAGNDVLAGGAGNDILDGGVGNDTLSDTSGNDTYLMRNNMGQDTIEDAQGEDSLVFSDSIRSDQLWFRKIGNTDLEVSIIGTNDKVTVKNWYTNTSSRIEKITSTMDNKTLLSTQVENLVNAMAGLTPPPAGQTSLSPDYQRSLQPTIAANWR